MNHPADIVLDADIAFVSTTPLNVDQANTAFSKDHTLDKLNQFLRTESVIEAQFLMRTPIEGELCLKISGLTKKQIELIQRFAKTQLENYWACVLNTKFQPKFVNPFGIDYVMKV